MKNFLILIVLVCCSCNQTEEWQTIFDGNSFDGWDIKIRYHELGENYNNTFKAEDGQINVSYEDYDEFEDKFGHIFYTKEKFKNYHLSLDYKFSGNFNQRIERMGRMVSPLIYKYLSKSLYENVLKPTQHLRCVETV